MKTLSGVFPRMLLNIGLTVVALEVGVVWVLRALSG